MVTRRVSEEEIVTRRVSEENTPPGTASLTRRVTINSEPEENWVLDFEIQRSTRKCHATERELKPGEKFYSVLVPEGAEVVRYDYASEAWQGPPENAIGWWQAEVPDPQAKKVSWAPNDVMLHLFQQWESDPTQADIRYVLTLLMVRRRILRLEEIERAPGGEETMVVFCQGNETEYKVPVHQLDAQRAASIQDELGKLLFSHS